MRNAIRRPATTVAAIAATIALSLPASAGAAVPHVVQPGETLWSIAAANNFTTRTVAAFNGLPEDAVVVAGQTVQIPTVAEGAAALVASGIVPGAPSEPASTGVVSSAGSHLVTPGETLTSIAAANGISTAALASANGRSADSFVYAGETLEVPPASAAPAATGVSPAAGLGHVPSPYGELHLDPAASEAWNAMRTESLRLYGQDLYPGGPLSAHRTYEQQAELYDLYVSGQGAPANPPGTSTHELGVAVDVEQPEMRWVIDQIGLGFGWGKTEAPTEWWHVNYAP